MTDSEFEPEIAVFDRSPAPPAANVFYGSSSIRLWDNLAQAFPGLSVLNRGFGGSTLAECLYFLPRVILPLRPATLVVYAADNDLDQGVPPETALYLFRQFVERVREDYPTLPVAFISIKPSPARFWNIANIRQTNTLIQAAAASYAGVTFIDVFSLMLSPSGCSRPDFFTEDGLHMNADGYALWTGQLRPWLDAPPTNNSHP